MVPTRPITVSISTSSPLWLIILDKWAYSETSPFPWSTKIIFPYPNGEAPDSITLPFMTGFTGFPILLAKSMPGWNV